MTTIPYISLFDRHVIQDFCVNLQSKPKYKQYGNQQEESAADSDHEEKEEDAEEAHTLLCLPGEDDTRGVADCLAAADGTGRDHRPDIPEDPRPRQADRPQSLRHRRQTVRIRSRHIIQTAYSWMHKDYRLLLGAQIIKPSKVRTIARQIPYWCRNNESGKDYGQANEVRE